MPDPLISLVVFGCATAVLALLFWPDRGLYPRWRRAQALSARVLREDALKRIYQQSAAGRRPTVQSVAGALHISLDQATRLMTELVDRGLLSQTGDDWQLSGQGKSLALNIIRAHRLYESYLAQETGFHQAEWHTRAEWREHRLSPHEADVLALHLGNPSHDPHGDPIPTAGGDLGSHGGRSLNLMAEDQWLRVVHVEDEPEAVYAQLLAEGIHPGMVIRLIEKSPNRLVVWGEEREFVLAPTVAGSLSVIPLPSAAEKGEEAGQPLSTLQPGWQARVLRISPGCRGAERNRFLDLGIVPGTLIRAEFSSSGGDPTAYRIRGALIALRQEQAELIRVTDIHRDADEEETQFHAQGA